MDGDQCLFSFTIENQISTLVLDTKQEKMAEVDEKVKEILENGGEDAIIDNVNGAQEQAKKKKKKKKKKNQGNIAWHVRGDCS